MVRPLFIFVIHNFFILEFIITLHFIIIQLNIFYMFYIDKVHLQNCMDSTEIIYNINSRETSEQILSQLS